MRHRDLYVGKSVWDAVHPSWGAGVVVEVKSLDILELVKHGFCGWQPKLKTKVSFGSLTRLIAPSDLRARPPKNQT